MSTVRSPEPFMSDTWLDGLRELLEERAPRTEAVLGDRTFTIAEAFHDAPNAAGTDGWYVTFHRGRVAAFGRGAPAGGSDLCNRAAYRDAAVLAADAHATPDPAVVQTTIGPDPDLTVLVAVGAALDDLHGAIAARTRPPTS